MNGSIKSVGKFSVRWSRPHTTNYQSNRHAQPVEECRQSKITAVPEKSEDEYPEQCDAFD
jgi:hypothetical protein